MPSGLRSRNNYYCCIFKCLFFGLFFFFVVVLIFFFPSTMSVHLLSIMIINFLGKQHYTNIITIATFILLIDVACCGCCAYGKASTLAAFTEGGKCGWDPGRLCNTGGNALLNALL